jgi:hypothetical protein
MSDDEKKIVYQIHECKYESIIRELSKNSNEMHNILNTISAKMDKTDMQLVDIGKRLFIDNGNLSIQTQLREANARFKNIETRIDTLDKNVTELPLEINKKINLSETKQNKLVETKVEELKKIPPTFALYTIGLISILGTLIGVVLWLIDHYK